MAAMARTSTLEEALEMFKHFVIIVRSPHFTADVSNSLQRLCICFGAEASSSLLVEDDNDIPDLEVNLPDEDRFCSSLLETYHDSPFYKEFKKVFDDNNIDVGSINACIENRYHVPKVLDYLLGYILAFYPLWSKYLQCMLLPDSDNPLTNFAVELRIRLVKVETMGKMAYQQAPRVVKKLVHDAEDRIIELNYDTNIWKGTRKRKQNQVGDERPAKNRAREMWKRTVAKLKMAGGIHSRKETTDYGQKLLEKVLEIPIPGQVKDIDLEVNTSEVDALMTDIDFMSLPKTFSTYPQTSVEDGYADHSQKLLEKQLEIPIPSQVENIDLEVNAPEVDTLLTELMSLPETLSTYPQTSVEDGYADHSQKLLEKQLEIPIPSQVENIDLEVNAPEVDTLLTELMSLPETLSTYPQTSVEDGYADHSQKLLEKQLEIPIPSQVENIDLEVNAPEVDTLLTELMSLPELLSTYPHWQVSIEDGYVERDVSGQVIQCLESYLQEGNLKILNQDINGATISMQFVPLHLFSDVAQVEATQDGLVQAEATQGELAQVESPLPHRGHSTRYGHQF